MVEIIKAAGSPPSTSPVSQATRAAGLVFVGGQMPRDESGGIPQDPAQQVRLTMQHCLAVLAAANCGPGDVALATVFLTDLKYKPLVNEEFVKVFGNRGPARNLVEVSAIGEGAVVEFAMVAESNVMPR